MERGQHRNEKLLIGVHKRTVPRDSSKKTIGAVQSRVRPGDEAVLREA
jgi:hypothetical protein